MRYGTLGSVALTLCLKVKVESSRMKESCRRFCTSRSSTENVVNIRPQISI